MAKTISSTLDVKTSTRDYREMEPVERDRYIDEVTSAFDEVQNLFDRLTMMKDRLIGTSNVDANEKAMRSHDGAVGRLVLKASMIREEVKRMHSLLNELDEYL